MIPWKNKKEHVWTEEQAMAYVLKNMQVGDTIPPIRKVITVRYNQHLLTEQYNPKEKDAEQKAREKLVEKIRDLARRGEP